MNLIAMYICINFNFFAITKYKFYNNSPLVVESYYKVSIFFGMTKSNRFDEGRSENLKTSSVLYFHTFFTIY